MMIGNVGSAANGNVSGATGDAQNAHALKFQNQNSILNHKQFSMSTQHGLFPKIINIRTEN